MDPSEVEFLAEKEFVTVVPNFALDKIYLIGVSDRFCIFNSKLFFFFNYTVIHIKIKIPESNRNLRL